MHQVNRAHDRERAGVVMVQLIKQCVTVNRKRRAGGEAADRAGGSVHLLRRFQRLDLVARDALRLFAVRPGIHTRRIAAAQQGRVEMRRGYGRLTLA